MKPFGMWYQACAGMLGCVALLALRQPMAASLPPCPAPAPNSQGAALLTAGGFLDSLLRAVPGPYDSVLAQPAKYELQIIYTRIDRDSANHPSFTEFRWNVDTTRYFNPASLVKLPTAVAALQKVRRYAPQGVSAATPMATGVAYRCQTPVLHPFHKDPDRVASVGNYVRRMLLVSDNEAYNRLYEFVGQRELHQKLTAWHMPTARIVTRFAPGCDSLSNRFTNPVTFYPAARPPVYQSAEAGLPRTGLPTQRILKGTGYRQAGRLIARPFDFTQANCFTLPQATRLLRGILFPTTQPQLDLLPPDRNLLLRYLSQTPHQSGFSMYKADGWFAAHKKYLYYGRARNRVVGQGAEPTVFNVVGLSYGYLSDCAYFANRDSRTEFLLSAVIYVNRNGILNDGHYEYATLGWPFMEWLGQRIFAYEEKRPRSNPANLSEFFAFNEQ